jgi:hypothetical protein
MLTAIRISKLRVDNYSPWNMTSASLPLPVFMKNLFSLPLGDFTVIFDVGAEEHPPPPAEDTDVFARSTLRTSATAESSFMAVEGWWDYFGWCPDMYAYHSSRRKVHIWVYEYATKSFDVVMTYTITITLWGAVAVSSPIISISITTGISSTPNLRSRILKSKVRVIFTVSALVGKDLG